MSTFNLDSWLEEMEKQAENTPEITEDQEKLAAVEEEGKILAHAFIAELEKIAVGDAPITPDTAGVKTPSEVNHVEAGTQLKKGQVDKVTAILNSLTAATRAGVGEIATPAGASPEAQSVIDENPLPADAAIAAHQQEAIQKTAANQILSNLYQRYFGEE